MAPRGLIFQFLDLCLSQTCIFHSIFCIVSPLFLQDVDILEQAQFDSVNLHTFTWIYLVQLGTIRVDYAGKVSSQAGFAVVNM